MRRRKAGRAVEFHFVSSQRFAGMERRPRADARRKGIVVGGKGICSGRFVSGMAGDAGDFRGMGSGGMRACSARNKPENAYRNGNLYAAYTAEALKDTLTLERGCGRQPDGSGHVSFEFEAQLI